MPHTEAMSDAQEVAANNTPGRDRAVDVARLAALVVVLFGHCTLLLATIDADGVRIGNLLGEVPAITPITWVVQVMPLFSSQAAPPAHTAGTPAHLGALGCSRGRSDCADPCSGTSPHGPSASSSRA